MKKKSETKGAGPVECIFEHLKGFWDTECWEYFMFLGQVLYIGPVSLKGTVLISDPADKALNGDDKSCCPCTHSEKPAHCLIPIIHIVP